MSRAVDIHIERHGSLFLFNPCTEAAREWIRENVGGNETWYAGGLAVEPRYAQALAWGMMADGLRVK